jgi:hypothetical protein
MADLFSLGNLNCLLWINNEQISCIGRSIWQTNLNPIARPAATKAEVSVPSKLPYARRLADRHPCSGRLDNSFMPRRPYAGVAPAQPGPTTVASTSTSAGAAPGCIICVWLTSMLEEVCFEGAVLFLTWNSFDVELSFVTQASRHHSRGLRAHPLALCPETRESHQPSFRQS